MPEFSRPHYKRKKAAIPRRIILLIIVLLVLVFGGMVVVRRAYSDKLRPVSTNQTTQIFEIPSGSSVKTIAASLESKHLIRSAWALELYVHSKELGGKFQAGSYALSPSQGTKSIIAVLTKGKVATRLVTILPGRRIDQVRADLINDGFTPADVDSALDPAQYADLPVISYKPLSVTTLEGLLWPDSYQKDASTSAAVIIRESLVAMGEHLTPDIQQAFANQNLSTYQGLIVTSIVTQEVNKPADQAQAAQVFLLRLKQGIMLGSDVTAFYGSETAGKGQSVTYDTTYNTRIHTGLPPTPISTITASALTATAHPATTDWLFFVAGDDGTTYFSHTQAEHDALTQKYCHKLCN
ncbi:MAG: Endolytic transglycosylase MltG [Candidatus Saccharibacteria bacterium]|nr:Endolytic transglycosylase MltG [Candidatus Saccharibacteria bacterium]